MAGKMHITGKIVLGWIDRGAPLVAASSLVFLTAPLWAQALLTHDRLRLAFTSLVRVVPWVLLCALVWVFFAVRRRVGRGPGSRLTTLALSLALAFAVIAWGTDLLTPSVPAPGTPTIRVLLLLVRFEPGMAFAACLLLMSGVLQARLVAPQWIAWLGAAITATAFAGWVIGLFARTPSGAFLDISSGVVGAMLVVLGFVVSRMGGEPSPNRGVV